MNKINSIYTTVSRGQVHIAADTKYIGSVDSYNNFFTQFFARLSSNSMNVNFDGKERRVNKESYALLLRTLTPNDRIEDIRKCNLFRPIAESAALPKTELKMRDIIESKDRRKLFEKLAIAISEGNTTKALLMIGKGAELDTNYIDRGQELAPSFINDSWDLRSSSRYTFTVFQAPPILQAARKGNKAVVEFLKEAKANLYAVGKEYTFKREIMDVRNHLELTVGTQIVPHHYHTKDAEGRDQEHVEYKLGIRPKLETRPVVTTLDSRIDVKTYQLSKWRNSIDLVLKKN